MRLILLRQTWRLGRPQRRSGCCGEEKALVLPRIETRAIQPVALIYFILSGIAHRGLCLICKDGIYLIIGPKG
jgi:hypothetical protein